VVLIATSVPTGAPTPVPAAAPAPSTAPSTPAPADGGDPSWLVLVAGLALVGAAFARRGLLRR
jgi:hypothetical protein